MESLYSPSWHRVASLRPRLSARARFHRHVYRGEVWYVVRNPSTGKVHRLTPAAYKLVAAMNGERTSQEIWDTSLTEQGDDAPTQEETLLVIGLLYTADLLRCDVPPDTAQLFRRAQETDEKERRSRLNPISFRVSLFDPDAFLTRWKHLVSPIFSRSSAVLWCVVVGAAGVLALANAPELAAGARTLLEPESLVALWFTYPIVKTLHEFGHAFAVKRWRGEVHDIGILFLVFMPVPYVDASAATVFEDKRRRMVVGAAGIFVEVFLASVALLVWLAVEPGWVRHVAYAVMLVGGISTLLFNGNPLLRFDGYYVFADWVEIPNLASKSNQALKALSKRLFLGMKQCPLPETGPGEMRWLVPYAIASTVYRTGILFGIALYLASEFFVVGVGLAIATLLMRVVFPMLRLLAFVLTDPVVGEHRGRALVGSLGLLAVLATLLFTVPIPLRTRAEGVIWLPEQSHVRAGADGFIEAVLAPLHSRVDRGQALIQTRDPRVEAQVQGLEARVRERRLRLLALDPMNRVATEGARAKLADAEAELQRAQERAGDVLMRSPTAGVFVVADGRDLIGRYVEQGEVVAYVVDLETATARVVVHQEDAALLRERTSSVWLRLDHDLGTVLPASIAREVPAATHQLPSPALGTLGGGPFAVDPRDPDGLTTLERVFQFDLSLPSGTKIPAVGERVYARFDLAAEPVAQRVYRSLRRLFMRQLGV